MFLIISEIYLFLFRTHVIIDELTNKVSVFYEEMKKSVENVSPYRWELLNRMADRSLRV